MKILSAAILITCVPLVTANAQFELGKDASYFCVAEAMGGLAYDATTKKWKGVAFRADKKFVLRLKHLRTQPRTGIIEALYDYSVTITAAGSNLPRPCDRYPEKHVTVPEIGWFVCNGDLEEYRFNLSSNRFLSAYLIGYVDGEDNNENTPSVTGGTCTKID